MKKRKVKTFTLRQILAAMKRWDVVWISGQGRDWGIDWHNFKMDLDDVKKRTHQAK